MSEATISTFNMFVNHFIITVLIYRLTLESSTVVVLRLSLLGYFGLYVNSLDKA